MSKTIRALGLLCSVWPWLAGASMAQTDFPTRPIRIIAGFAPGGATDVATRIVGAKMAEEIGTQVIVENKPGAGTSIAGAAVAASEPDGYTLFPAGNASAVNAASEPKPPFDVLRAFVPVGTVATSPSVLVVPPAAGIKSIDDLIRQARTADGQVTFASAGAGAISHLAGELFALETGTKLTHVPYKGSSQAMTDLLAGRVTMMFAPIATALPFIRDGTLVSLAVTSADRQRDLPETVTLQEAGLKELDLGIWFGFVAPAGTPAERIAKLQAALGKAVDSAEVRAQFAIHGMQPAAEPTAVDFERRMRGDIDKLQKLFATTGLKIGR